MGLSPPSIAKMQDIRTNDHVQSRMWDGVGTKPRNSYTANWVYSRHRHPLVRTSLLPGDWELDLVNACVNCRGSLDSQHRQGGLEPRVSWRCSNQSRVAIEISPRRLVDLGLVIHNALKSVQLGLLALRVLAKSAEVTVGRLASSDVHVACQSGQYPQERRRQPGDTRPWKSKLFSRPNH